MFTVLLVAQGIALVVLIGRLLPGRNRRPPVLPVEDRGPPRVSVLVPTFNEVKRLRPCLEGLMQQGATVREVLVVDGNSSDGTSELVAAVSARDGRVRIIFEPPLPNGWIGKVWALQQGLEQTAGEWVLNVDADIEPEPGMVAAAVEAAERLDLDVVSFAPRFAAQTAAEQWLQPAMLVTLIYRNGVAGRDGRMPPERTMANGQCFLARRDILVARGGYAPARASFSDDVTLARRLARRGARVGFLDGSRLFTVRSYASLGEMWREWGRSIDLKDATTLGRQLGDIALIGLTQGVPIILLIAWVLGAVQGGTSTALLLVNVALIGIRVALSGALAQSYSERHWTYWLSPIADPLAVVRVIMSSLMRKKSWRGRQF
jgi:dolichol-phosphate mannosyltransferase